MAKIELSEQQKATIGKVRKDRNAHVKSMWDKLISANLSVDDGNGGRTKVDDAYLTNLSDGQIESAASRYISLSGKTYIAPGLDKTNPLYSLYNLCLGLVIGQVNAVAKEHRSDYAKDRRYFDEMFPVFLQTAIENVEQIVKQIGPITKGQIEALRLLNTPGVSVGGAAATEVFGAALLGAGAKVNKADLAATAVRRFAAVADPEKDKDGNFQNIGDATFSG